MKKLFLLLAFCSPIYSMRYLTISPKLHRSLYSSIMQRNLSNHSDKLGIELSCLANQLQDTAILVQLLKESYENENDRALQAIIKSLPKYVEGCLDSTLELKKSYLDSKINKD